jgi:UDP-N-acetylglucosamine 4,6-dehydratase (inverting)
MAFRPAPEGRYRCPAVAAAYAPPFAWNEATILLTGGTGSFGRAFLEHVLATRSPQAIRVFSRDELKQSELQERFAAHGNVRWFIGDVRDRDRLARAAEGADLIVHAAALKQVPLCEYNPFEAVRTNVHGAENVVNVALEKRIPRVLALSTDKAVNPINLYGATKLCAEKIVVQGNTYAAASPTRLACVRYGNVAGSRGSVIPLFLKQRQAGRLTLTDPRMTRYFITVTQAVEFVVSCAERMLGGEVFVPKIPSARIEDLAEAIAPDVPREIVGIRPGEKLHEILITSDEARHTLEQDDRFVILPEFHSWSEDEPVGGEPLPSGFTYASDTNEWWLSTAELVELADAVADDLVRV